MFAKDNSEFSEQNKEWLTVTSPEVSLTMFTNSKLLYIEQSYKRELDHFQSHTIYRRCLLHRELLKNRLAVAPLSPHTVSALLKNRPENLGVVLGEALYIFECMPRKVTMRRPENRRCYKQLPVWADEEAVFLAPVTRIIQNIGEEISCSDLAPALFRIENQWLGLSLEPITSIVPETLQVSEEPKYKFKPIQRVSAEWIYTREELVEAREVLMHGVEREALGNILVKRFGGTDVDMQGKSTLDMFTELDLETLAKDTASRLWGWLKVLENFTSAVLGIYFIIKVAKFGVEVIINGIALHRAFGCTFAILASVCDVLSLLIIAKKDHKKTEHDESALFTMCQ